VPTPETSASLLERLRQQPDAASWERLVSLYTPLLRGWLRRQAIPLKDVDDLVQDVMAVLVRELGQFHYDPERGSFRGWLRTIVANRARAFWRSQRTRPQAAGNDGMEQRLNELEDPHSDLSKQWEHEHDLHVVRRLLEAIAHDFEPTTWQAFCRLVLDRADGSAVADELGISINAVYLARHRVLRRLRQEIRGLTD
jgi:RNA polymerase sigma factor (sigma-70 family)